jgi:hypothetical protein
MVTCSLIRHWPARKEPPVSTPTVLLIAGVLVVALICRAVRTLSVPKTDRSWRRAERRARPYYSGGRRRSRR